MPEPVATPTIIRDRSPIMKFEGGTMVQFMVGTVRNNFQSTQKGTPVWDKVLLARLILPSSGTGQSRSEPHFEVERVFMDGNTRSRPWQDGMTQRDRFAKQLEVWEKGIQHPDVVGTPLEALTFLDIHIIASLHEQKILTVETLAEVPDTRLQSIGPLGRQWREQAKNYLEQVRGNAPITRLTAENEDLKAKVEALTQQMAELAARSQPTPEQQTKPTGRKAA